MPSIAPDTGRSQHNTPHQSLTCIQHLSSLDESGQDPERARMENLNYLLSKVFDGWRMATNKVLITEPSPSPGRDTLQCPWCPPALATSPLLMVSGWSPGCCCSWPLQTRRTNVNVLVPVSPPVQCPRPCEEQCGSVITVIAWTNNHHTRPAGQRLHTDNLLLSSDRGLEFIIQSEM